MRRYTGSALALAAVVAFGLVACKPAPAPAPAPAADAATLAPAPAPAADAATLAPAASDAGTQPAPAPAPAATAAPSPAQFAGRIWEVKESATVEKGTTYAFLADGGLIIDGPGGTPLQAQWKFDAGQLTLIEEGQAYPADILKLDANEFRIRSHNPGEPVEVLLVPAANQTLPKAAM